MGKQQPLILADIVANTPVFRKSDPSALGFFTGRHQRAGPVVLAQVQWATGSEYVDLRTLIKKLPDSASDLESKVARGEYGGIRDLQRRITYEKLRGTLTDMFYSMSAAQMDFLAYQFKPVLKFVDSPTNRLLIADEVGLGKTIEAGLIWTECQARFQARRLLVVCKKSLCAKWVRELRQRFQLPAQETDAPQLLDHLGDWSRQGAQQSFVLVSGYEGLRPSQNDRHLLDPIINPRRGEDRVNVDDGELTTRGRILRKLAEWEPDTPFIDLVVFDEAHWMKNTASLTYTLGKVYSQNSGASLCLTATPIHNQSRDLFALLHLVDPDYFHEQYVFESLRTNNLPIVRLMNQLSSHTCDPEDILSLCREVGDSGYFADSPLVKQLVSLASNFDRSPKATVALHQIAEQMNLFGAYINRTRKVQVVERRVQREPVTLTVELSPEEKTLYRAVLKQVRRQVRLRGEVVTSFHLIAPALRMSSCIPSMVECLRLGKWGGIEELEQLADEFNSDYEEDTEQSAFAPADILKRLQDHDFEENDTKYNLLREELLKRIPGEKVVVFAFFKDTIRYLHRRLTADGIPCLAVTGDTSDKDERDRLLMGFEDDAHRVLLCSEIGAEGIDLQFCRIMVNYDLPWNPMKVEQRIGRIDRIGQQAKSIVIINFHIKDTIDGRIYAHLFNKIHIFEQTIGDLEGIIGEEVNRLTASLLKDELSAEEEERVIEAARQAIENRRELEKELEQSSGALIAYSDYLADQVGDSRRLGRFVQPDELRLYVDDFFADHFPGCEVNWDTPAAGCCKLRLTFDAHGDIDTFMRKNNLAWPRGYDATSRTLMLAFDPAVYQAARKKSPQLVLANHLHPLIKWITSANQLSDIRLHGVAAARVTDSSVPAGPYFYLIRRLTLDGLRKRERLLYGLYSMSNGTIVTGESAERVLNTALLVGDSMFPDDPKDGSAALRALQARLGDLAHGAAEEFKREMASKALIQKEKTRIHFDRKLDIARSRLTGMLKVADQRTRGIQLTQSQIDSLTRRKQEALQRFEDAAQERIAMDDVTCGLLEVVCP